MIEGLVAQIISARELAINVGANHGVKEGMRFAVRAETPIEVHDPKTNELLDVIDREKVRVEATEVRSRITICRTYRTKYTPAGPLYFRFPGLTAPPHEKAETLKADDKSYPEPLSPEESYVKIGDRIIQVTEQE